MKIIRTANHKKLSQREGMIQQFTNQIRNVDSLPQELRQLFIKYDVQPHDIANIIAMDDNIKYLVDTYIKNKDQSILMQLEQILGSKRYAPNIERI